MDELLEQLKTQIRSIIHHHDRLQSANQHLSKGKFLLLREKELILARQQAAIVQIETLISKLKSIEKLL